MTTNEFKQWLDGFVTAVNDTPTPEQWAYIKKALEKTTPLPLFPAPLFKK